MSRKFYIVGLLKDNGYPYPNCLPDGDRLLVAYSMNKEDMACGTIDLTTV